MSTRPKYYAEVCMKEPPAYSDYTNTPDITYGKLEDYEIIRKLGRGKYSDVFEGVKMSTGQPVV